MCRVFLRRLPSRIGGYLPYGASFAPAASFTNSFGGTGFSTFGAFQPSFVTSLPPYGLGYTYPWFSVGPKQPAEKPHDHIGQFNFKVEIEGITAGRFKKVDSLDSEIEVIEYQDGDDIFTKKKPGGIEYKDITLSEGIISASPAPDGGTETIQDYFSRWHQEVLDGILYTKKEYVNLYDQAGNEILRYTLYGAWPSKLRTTSLDGKGNDVLIGTGGDEVAIEEVTLVYQDADVEIKKFNTRNLPYSGNNCEVFVDGERLAVFEDAVINTGIEAEVVVYEGGDPEEPIYSAPHFREFDDSLTYTDSNGNEQVLRKRPGRVKYSNITLKRGYLDSGIFWDWYKGIAAGAVDGIKKSGSVVVSKPGNTVPIVQYEFFEAWPCKWKGWDLDGKGTDVTVEEVELAVEKVYRKND